MKPLLTFLLFLVFPGVLCSQIRAISEKDSAAIPYAHIFLDDTFYTYSDENGAFTIDAKQKFDTLKIAHLSYETRLVPSSAVKNNSVIMLAEKENLLEEVSVVSNRKKWKKETLLPGRPGGLSSGKRDLLLLDDWGAAYGRDGNSDEVNISKAVYVPNESREGVLITKIILSSVDKEVEGDTQYIPFRVNLMTYDTINRLPGEKIFAEDFTVGKTKGQTVVIDLTDYGFVTLPPEGICIVVSVYHTQYYANNGLRPPAFEASRINKSSGFREYSFGFRKEKLWEEQSYSELREQCFNWGIETESAD